MAQAFQVTDEGLAHLAGFTKLRRLDLRRLALNGSGLVHLKGMSELKSLDLGGTPISDEALVHLTALPKIGRAHV